MKFRITALISALIITAGCIIGCDEKKEKDTEYQNESVSETTESNETDDDYPTEITSEQENNTESQDESDIETAESNETENDYPSGVTYELSDDFIESADREREYSYKDEKIELIITGLLAEHGTTAQTYGDRIARCVFPDDDIVEKDVIQRNSMDVSVYTTDVDGYEGFDYYTSFDLFYENRHCFSFCMYYTVENKELSRSLAYEIIDSIKLPQTDYSYKPAGEIEKKCYRLNAGEKWSIEEHIVNNHDIKNDDFGRTTLRYCIADNLDKFFSKISVFPVYRKGNDTARDYMDEKFESVSKLSSASYSSRPKKTTFNGDDAYVFEWEIYKSMLVKQVVYYVEHKDAVYQINYSYGLYDNTAEDIEKDILAVLDTIEFSDDVSVEDIMQNYGDDSEEKSDE